MTTGTGTDCGIELIDSAIDKLVVGPPYNQLRFGGPPASNGLKLLTALLDNQRVPLQVCGDHGVGDNAFASGFLDGDRFRYTKIDNGPVPDSPVPATPPFYPGVGITAYGCILNCTYEITGDLGAEVIVGKIDGQWHILRVIGNANNGPIVFSNNDCRCCGYTSSVTKFKAKILEVSPDSCSGYQVDDEFDLNPVAEFCTNSLSNPLRIRVSCHSTANSLFEDPADWSARVCDQVAEIVSVDCCAPILGTGSGTGTGTSECRLEIVIQTGSLPGCGNCSFKLLVWGVSGDPCVKFADTPIEEVTAEACGLTELKANDRVILVKIPGGVGNQVLGEPPIEWFVVRACSSKSCDDPCDEETPVGPPCCGKLCSQMPNILNVTVEYISDSGPFPSINCTAPVSFQIAKHGGLADQCDGAADTRWSLVAPIPDGTFCPGTTDQPPPDTYPTWLDIEAMVLRCDEVFDICGTGTADGPSFPLTMSGGLEVGEVSATQNLAVSCCDPLYLEYMITGQFGMVAGAGEVNHTVTLKITITE